MYSKKDKDGKYFMNVYDFKSFLSVFLDVNTTQNNKSKPIQRTRLK